MSGAGLFDIVNLLVKGGDTMSTMSTSTAFSAHSIAAALKSVDEKLGQKLEWVRAHKRMSHFLDVYDELRQLDFDSVPELSFGDSLTVADINKKAKEMGVQSEMTKSRIRTPNTVPVSVWGKFDVLVNWLKSGEPEAITWTRDRDEFAFPAVKMNGRGVEIVKSPNHDHPIAILKTEGDYEVVLTEASPYLSGIDLLLHMKEILLKMSHWFGFSGVRFPMVDLRNSPDMNWIIGMTAPCGITELMPMDGTNIYVRKAMQDNLLRMNEVGARVVSLTRIGLHLIGASADYVSPQPLVIEEPFYMAVIKPGEAIPYFVAYVTEECWKKPSSLTNVA